MSSGPTASPSSKTLPKDALVNEAILREMGVTDYEPRLVNQMLEFTYRYVSDILEDAKVYSQHANKKSIDIDDVKLAVQCKLDHSFTNPPPRDLLLDVARLKNSTPLPPIKPYTGPRLPPDRYCLTTPNFRLRSFKKPKPSVPSGGSGTPKFTITQTAAAKAGLPVGPTLSVLPKSSGPTFSIKPGGPVVKAPVIRVTPGAPGGVSGLPGPQTISAAFKINPGGPSSIGLESSLKRKREDDL